MRILVVTPAVDKNNQALGFFHKWVYEMSRQCSSVTVFTLEVGLYDLPAHVKVYHLGNTPFQRVYRLLKYSIRYKDDYDAVFVHMGPIFVCVTGLLWRFLKKRVVLWYSHKSVTLTLRIAHALVHAVCTAASESFRIKSKKVNVIGHGIDLSFCTPGNQLPPEGNETWKLLSVGRITAIKNTLLLIETLKILSDRGISAHLTLVGKTITKEDEIYEHTVLKSVIELGIQQMITFKGAVPYEDIVPIFQRAHVHLNFCPTGGLDKVVIEGMATGAVPFVRNEAFTRYFNQHQWVCNSSNPEELATALISILNKKTWSNDRIDAIEIAQNNFDLIKLISKILNILYNHETSR